MNRLAPALVAAVVWMAATAPAALAASPVQIHVALEPQVIGVDETATLTIEAEGGGIASLQFEPDFRLENLERADGGSRAEDLSLINGSLSRSFRYSLRLRPVSAGPARVRSLLLHLRGQLVRLPDQQIHVQEQPTGQSPGAAASGSGGAGQPFGSRAPSPADLLEQLFGGSPRFGEPQRPLGPAAFLRAEVQPQKPLAGEQAIYAVYLYTRQEVAAINATAMPSFRGFWVRDLPQPERLMPEMVAVGSVRYGRVPILRKALFGLRPGRHVLEPAGCDVVIEPVSRGFFGPPPLAPEELHLRTPELAVEVQPLPSPPPGFGGLVGQLSLAAKLQPYHLRLGEGATLTVTLAGAGNLQGVSTPLLDLPSALSVFPPQQQFEDHLNGAIVSGRRTWTFVIVPRQAGHYEVKPQAIAYFDPAHHEYRLAEAPPLALTALPAPPVTGSAAAAGGPSSAGGATLLDQAAGRWSWVPRGGWSRPLPWLAVLAMATGIVLALMLSRRRFPVSSRRAAGVEKIAVPAELERKLREAASEERPRQAATLVEQGWRDYLVGRWGVPVSTPPASWGAALASHGAPPDVADQLVRLVEELHYLRYAPQLSTTGAVRDQLLASSRLLLRRLR